MRCSRILSAQPAVAVAVLLGATTAQAADGAYLKYEISSAAGAFECKVQKDGVASSPTLNDGKIEITGIDLLQADNIDAVELVKEDKTAIALKPPATPWVIKRADVGEQALFVRIKYTKAAKAEVLECGANDARRIFREAESSKDEEPGNPLDLPAAGWLLEHGDEVAKLKAALTAQGLPSDTTLLIHLPSGMPAAPFPSSLREGSQVLPVLIVDAKGGLSAELDVKSCEELETFRTKLSEAEGEEQAATRGAKPSFKLHPIGQWLACGAGDLEYEIATKPVAGSDQSASEHTTTVRMRPVHHVAAIAAVGVDFTETDGYRKRTDRSDDPPTTTVAETTDREGVKAYVGAVWMVGGVDYEDMDWHNYFLNPMIAVDPSSPLEDVVAGLAVTPTGGISLALGVALHKGVRLEDYSVGEAFEGDGDVPTQSTWKELETGFFVGLALDSNVLEAIKATFASGD